MTRGTICDFCKSFYPNDLMYRMSKELNLIKENKKTKHICKKCCKKVLRGLK